MSNLYSKLLTPTRRRDTEMPNRNLLLESESDRSRIVFSAPFRRLQQKAQVFSLEANAAVRSRLTHSFEVAQVGRFLSAQIVASLSEKNWIDELQGRAFITFVEVACLMHDLGNPPFGHFGEVAITQWFQEKGEQCLRSAINLKERRPEDPVPVNIQSVLADFLEFDGNCQGLRIASLLQWKDDEYGLNLTYTSLASYLKYIRSPLFNALQAKDRQFQKKAGYFGTEKKLVEMMWTHFKYDIQKPQRFPLAYVMEAADDIAYCISDLEDSIEKGLLTESHVFQDLLAQWESDCNDFAYLKTSDDEGIRKILATAAEKSKQKSNAAFTNFRTNLSRLLTTIACKSYCDQHTEIFTGACKGLIIEESAGGHVLKMLKKFCRTHVYQHHTVQRTELVGLSAIRGLLNHFGVLLKCSREKFDQALDPENRNNETLFEKKLLSLFPDKHINAYSHVCSLNDKDINLNDEDKRLLEWNLRAHLVTDFISGMTDDFALSSFQWLSGIRAN
jgi:dGTPase